MPTIRQLERTGWSAGTLTAVIAAGLGATILPDSMAREVTASVPSWRVRIVEPTIEAPLALCQSDHLPLSEPAQAVRGVLLDLVREWPQHLLPEAVRPAAPS